MLATLPEPLTFQDAQNDVEVSVVMPCLNEALTGKALHRQGAREPRRHGRPR